MTVGRIPNIEGGIQPTLLTTTGDIMYASSASNPARLGIGSTNQVLGVTAGVPAYQASSKSTLTTTGDILYASAANTPARLGIGSTGQILTVASGLPSWATPTAAGANWSLVNAGGTSLSGATTTISGISGADKIMILWTGASSTGAAAFSFRLNGDTGSNYYSFGWGNYLHSSYQPSSLITNSGLEGTATTSAGEAYFANAASIASGYVLLSGCNSSGVKIFEGVSGSGGGSTATTGTRASKYGGYYNSSSTISSIALRVDAGTFDAGTVYVYTSA